ncbi:uncharacterized protein LOC132031980 [Lycium ferocissimum]|uniref:uncharacterized protein LOC132031980 n=1 Tax=Lycium ferocissimum TaxID=112874 RepID=UPI00281621EB|nr:uncharacterized protein LOC132031980 [Lycium ferocissimum]
MENLKEKGSFSKPINVKVKQNGRQTSGIRAELGGRFNDRSRDQEENPELRDLVSKGRRKCYLTVDLAEEPKLFLNTNEMDIQDSKIKATSQSIDNFEKPSQDKENPFSQSLQRKETESKTIKASNMQQDKSPSSECQDKVNKSPTKGVRSSEEVKEAHVPSTQEESESKFNTLSGKDKAPGSSNANLDLVISSKIVSYDAVPLAKIFPERDHSHDAHKNDSNDDEVLLASVMRKGSRSKSKSSVSKSSKEEALESALKANKAKGIKRTRSALVKSHLIDEAEPIDVEAAAAYEKDKDFEVRRDDAPSEKKNCKKKKKGEKEVTQEKSDKSMKESNITKRRRSRNDEESCSMKRPRVDQSVSEEERRKTFKNQKVLLGRVFDPEVASHFGTRDLLEITEFKKWDHLFALPVPSVYKAQVFFEKLQYSDDHGTLYTSVNRTIFELTEETLGAILKIPTEGI